jgi:hypothetical protein
MSVLAAAPVPFLAAVTVIALALLAVIARAVFAPTDGPARRLCAILAILRRPRSGIDACRLLIPASPHPAHDSPESPLPTAGIASGRPPGREAGDMTASARSAIPSPRTAQTTASRPTP